ncbi:MAG: tetratricopeptide (TPR) repeat protein, partial [Kiritimatiellia bacterium]
RSTPPREKRRRGRGRWLIGTAAALLASLVLLVVAGVGVAAVSVLVFGPPWAESVPALMGDSIDVGAPPSEEPSSDPDSAGPPSEPEVEPATAATQSVRAPAEDRKPVAAIPHRRQPALAVTSESDKPALAVTSESDKPAAPPEFSKDAVAGEAARPQTASIRVPSYQKRPSIPVVGDDGALLDRALAGWAMGDVDTAVKDFRKLLKSYPNSQYAPYAFVFLGEYYFDKNNAFGALTSYKKASAFKQSEVYSHANYKLAWCYYNVGEYGVAIDTMKMVVSDSMASGRRGKNDTATQEESLKDLVRFYADAGEMDEAYEYFNKIGRKDLITDMLHRLAGMYLKQGKYDNAIQIYRRLIAEDPQSKTAYRNQRSIVSMYAKLGDAAGEGRERVRFARTYGPGSAWSRANQSNPQEVEEAARVADSYLK